MVEIEEELSLLTRLKLKIAIIGNEIADIKIENGSWYRQIIHWANSTIRKGKNVFISGIDLDSLKEGESVSSIITNLIDSVDESATIVDCKRLKSKDTNKYINKVIVTFNNTLLRDKINN